MKLFFSFVAALTMMAAPLCKAASPGQWHVIPEKLISGQQTDVYIAYEHTGKDMPAGSVYKLRIENISVKSLFHCIMSQDLALAAYKGKLPEVKMENFRSYGIGMAEVCLRFPSGLKNGESFKVAFGNKGADGKITALVNPFPMKNIVMAVWIDQNGKGDYAEWFDLYGNADLPRCSIVADKVSQLRVFLPSLAAVGEKIVLRVSATDAFDSPPQTPFDATVKIEDDGGLRGLPQTLAFRKGDNSFREIVGISAPATGVYRVTFELDGKRFESNPMVVKEKIDRNIYWGTIHNHSEFSECFGGPNDEVLSKARFSACLDYASLSDHFYQKPTKDDLMGTMEKKWNPQCFDTVRLQFMDFYKGRLLKLKYGHPISLYDAWVATIKSANKANVDGKFAALCGYEWSSQDAGHYNIYIENPSPANMDEYFLPFYDGFAATLIDHLKKSDALVIPHISAGYFLWHNYQYTARNKNGKVLMPSVESYSDWGDSFSPFKGVNNPDNLTGGMRNKGPLSVSEALELGYKFSLLGDADSHTGLIGRRVVGGISQSHDHRAGLTSVKAATLTRGSIMDAYRTGDSYATTGERIYLDFSVNGEGMGSSVAAKAAEKINADVFCAGTAPLRQIRLYCGSKVIDSFDPAAGARDVDHRFTVDMSKYGTGEHALCAEIVQSDENMAWSSPIWVNNDDKQQSPKDFKINICQEPKLPSPHKEGVIFWAQQLTDDVLTLSVRCRAPEVTKGVINVSGAEVLSIEQNYSQEKQMVVRSGDAGSYRFEIPVTQGALHKTNGFSLMLKVTDKNAKVGYIFDREVSATDCVTDCQGKIIKGKEVSIAVAKYLVKP